MSVWVLPEKLSGIGEAVFIVSHPMISNRIGLFAPRISEDDAISLPNSLLDDIDYPATIFTKNDIQPKTLNLSGVDGEVFFMLKERAFPNVKNPQNLFRSVEYFPYPIHYYVDFLALKVDAEEFERKFAKFVNELLAKGIWANAFFFKNYVDLSQQEKERHDSALKYYEKLFEKGA